MEYQNEEFLDDFVETAQQLGNDLSAVSPENREIVLQVLKDALEQGLPLGPRNCSPIESGLAEQPTGCAQ